MNLLLLLAARVRFQTGDFFTQPLPNVDVIIMGHILHDWNLDEKKMLIRKAYDALNPGGVLVAYDGYSTAHKEELDALGEARICNQSPRTSTAAQAVISVSTVISSSCPKACAASATFSAGDHCYPAGIRLDQLAAHMGMSERTLRRRCLDAFGYGFKTLDRVLRFQRFFRLAAQTSIGGLAELASRAGYADQAHMTREVQRMSGASASELVAQVQG